MKRSFGSIYSVNVKYSVVKDKKNIEYEIDLTNLEFQFNSSNKLEKIITKPNKFDNVTMEVEHNKIIMKVNNGLFIVDSKLLNENEIYSQLKFIAFEMEKNPNLWFKPKEEMFDPC